MPDANTYEAHIVPPSAGELPEFLSRELRDIANAMNSLQQQITALDARVTTLEP